MDEYYEDYCEEEQVSQLASGFGFDSDDEFNDYCDDFEKGCMDGGD